MTPEDHQLVFVGGLHRSGTSLVTRCIAEHPETSAFGGTGVPEDEGQHLQDVYPPASAYGGPGRFGLAPEAHVTEASSLVTARNAARLFEQWSRYWDGTKPVLVEKSPPNLIRARFLQALFPRAAFIMVTRHPIPVSLATERWCEASASELLEHWVRCHEIFRDDEPYLRRVRIVRYERLVADPAAEMGHIWRFLGLEPRPITAEISRDVDAAYFARWRERHRGVRGRRSLARLRRRLGDRIAAFGYRLTDTADPGRAPALG